MSMSTAEVVTDLHDLVVSLSEDGIVDRELSTPGEPEKDTESAHWSGLDVSKACLLSVLSRWPTD